MDVRPATLEDVPAVTRIYNDAILNTTATFDTVEKPLEDRREWLAAHGPKRPVLVATELDEVVGWAALSDWSERPAYSPTSRSTGSIRTSPGGSA